MPKYHMVMTQKTTWEFDVEAEDYADARYAALEASIDPNAPNYIEWDVYDIEEDKDDAS